MSKTLSHILTVFKVAKVIAKVVFILCIVGAAGCLLGFFAISAVDTFMPEALISEGVSADIGYLGCIIGVVICAAEAVFAFLSERYFKKVLNAGTPFTFDGAKQCFRLGIASLIISAAVSVISAIAVTVFLILANSGLSNSEFNVSFSITTGLLLMFLSIVFKHGAELHKASEEKAAPEEEEIHIELP